MQELNKNFMPMKEKPIDTITFWINFVGLVGEDKAEYIGERFSLTFKRTAGGFFNLDDTEFEIPVDGIIGIAIFNTKDKEKDAYPLLTYLIGDEEYGDRIANKKDKVTYTDGFFIPMRLIV